MPRGIYPRKKAASKVRRKQIDTSHLMEDIPPHQLLNNSERQELENYRTFFKILARLVG